MARIEMGDVLYGIIHPVNFIRAKVRQIEVSIEHAQPPVKSSFEEFPELPVKRAAELMGLSNNEGVQLNDWPKSTQNRC